MAVYFAQLGKSGPVKIGFASDVAKRVKGMQTNCPERLVVLRVIEGEIAAEKALHRRFANLRLHGEWFQLHDDMLHADLGYAEAPIPLLTRKVRKGRPHKVNAELAQRPGTVRGIIAAFGGEGPLAERLGFRHRTRVWNWWHIGIPRQFWPEIISLARVTPKADWITMDALLAAEASLKAEADLKVAG